MDISREADIEKDNDFSNMGILNDDYLDNNLNNFSSIFESTDEILEHELVQHIKSEEIKEANLLSIIDGSAK